MASRWISEWMDDEYMLDDGIDKWMDGWMMDRVVNRWMDDEISLDTWMVERVKEITIKVCSVI